MAYRDCPHTPGVVCDSKNGCVRCGWETEEKQRRKADIDTGKMRKNLWGVSQLWVKKKSRPSGANAESGMEKITYQQSNTKGTSCQC